METMPKASAPSEGGEGKKDTEGSAVAPEKTGEHKVFGREALGKNDLVEIKKEVAELIDKKEPQSTLEAMRRLAQLKRAKTKVEISDKLAARFKGDLDNFRDEEKSTPLEQARYLGYMKYLGVLGEDDLDKDRDIGRLNKAAMILSGDGSKTSEFLRLSVWNKYLEVGYKDKKSGEGMLPPSQHERVSAQWAVRVNSGKAIDKTALMRGQLKYLGVPVQAEDDKSFMAKAGKVLNRLAAADKWEWYARFKNIVGYAGGVKSVSETVREGIGSAINRYRQQAEEGKIKWSRYVSLVGDAVSLEKGAERAGSLTKEEEAMAFLAGMERRDDLVSPEQRMKETLGQNAEKTKKPRAEREQTAAGEDKESINVGGEQQEQGATDTVIPGANETFTGKEKFIDREELLRGRIEQTRQELNRAIAERMDAEKSYAKVLAFEELIRGKAWSDPESVKKWTTSEMVKDLEDQIDYYGAQLVAAAENGLSAMEIKALIEKRRFQLEEFTKYGWPPRPDALGGMEKIVKLAWQARNEKRKAEERLKKELEQEQSELAGLEKVGMARDLESLKSWLVQTEQGEAAQLIERVREGKSLMQNGRAIDIDRLENLRSSLIVNAGDLEVIDSIDDLWRDFDYDGAPKSKYRASFPGGLWSKLRGLFDADYLRKSAEQEISRRQKLAEFLDRAAGEEKDSVNQEIILRLAAESELRRLELLREESVEGMRSNT